MKKKFKSKTYSDAGVDLDAAARIKEKITHLTHRTLGKNVFSGPGGFGGPGATGACNLGLQLLHPWVPIIT